MLKNSQVENSAASARRRLIKGGFAMPAALTVASGSALARTSSGCVVVQANQHLAPAFSTLNTVYLRVPAWTYLSNSGNKTHVRSWWIRYADVIAVASAAGVVIKNNWLPSGAALCVVGGTQNGNQANFVAGTVYANPPTLTTAAGATPAQAARYYALTIDTSGDIIGVAGSYTASGQSGGAVSASCWTSFAVP